MKTLILYCLLVISSLSLSINDSEAVSLWNTWKIQHNKVYSPAEDTLRFAIFLENHNKIIDFNSKNYKVKLGLNEHADLTAEEFEALYTRYKAPQKNKVRNLEVISTEDPQTSDSELPASIDWRERGAVAPVEIQGTCDGAWIWTATGTLDSLYFNQVGKLVPLSGQQIIDCYTWDGMCTNLNVDQALDYTGQYGIETREDYPVTYMIYQCNYNASKAIHVNSGFKWLESNSTYVLKSALVKQTVAALVQANQPVFQFYKSGVITQDCGATVNQYVLVVGYTTIDGEEAFIIKNSWGTSRGDQGYWYISTNQEANDGAGVCGILSHPLIPLE